MMLEQFCPDKQIDSIFALDLTWLRARNIRGIIIDLDNTLVHWGKYEVDERLLGWLSRTCAQGFRLCIVSNNGGRKVTEFARRLDIPCVVQAGKPGRRAFRRALAVLGTQPEETVMVGDQLFTDIFGGKRSGLMTVLVTPLDPREFIWTRFVRNIERRVLAQLHRKGLLTPPQRREG